ncbi:restriction endonuclease subunit S [Massilia sp. CCM 8695]|uniref:Restriction endonuclease subunit S n=1 Tax=Massilia frigida TaxID=2609281 RepID=A0ABX0NCV8_9BURK|nr:restriction endonuclease subunit S [Massilia frigida]NHZ79550.1 restriction endonuclease subunit S [Massilia frigida]
MSLPRYGEYKKSELSWLGLVPAHWPIKRIRYVADLNPSKSELAGYNRNTVVSFLPMEAIGDDGSLNLDRTRTIAEVEVGYTYFRDGDVTLAKITPCFENGKGALIQGLREGIGFGTTELIVARPKSSEVLGPMLNWIFRSPGFRNQGEASMYGAGGQKRVPDNFLRDFAWPFPPINEQIAIIAFLDRETAKIDTLIAEQRKLIAVLAEKREATVSQAVTKGLNANAPRKNSGVAWLGEVPSHWEVVRIKRVIASIEQGWSPQCENFPISLPDEWGVLKVGCVNGGVFRPMENKKLPPGLEPVPAYSLKRGDLLISRANTRELVGSAAAVGTDFDNLMLCDKLYRLRLDNARCTPFYLAAYLGTPQARSQIELDATGASSSMLNIGQSAILDLLAPMPSVKEQNEIREFLRTETERLDTLNVVAERAIVLLKERRSALIAAAVTGQIDVRGVMSPALIEHPEVLAA